MTLRWRFVLAAILVALALLLLQALLRGDPERRNYEIFTEMAYSVAGESFAAADALPGGTVLQPVPAGVALRGRKPFRYGLGEEESKRAGEELQNPIPPDDATAVERGAQLFAIYCQICHDPRGDGMGLAVQRGMVPPPSLHAATALALKDGQIFHLLTLGRGNMASYAAQLTPLERWQVIRQVRGLQARRVEEETAAAAKAADAPAAQDSEAAPPQEEKQE